MKEKEEEKAQNKMRKMKFINKIKIVNIFVKKKMIQNWIQTDTKKIVQQINLIFKKKILLNKQFKKYKIIL